MNNVLIVFDNLVCLSYYFRWRGKRKGSFLLFTNLKPVFLPELSSCECMLGLSLAIANHVNVYNFNSRHAILFQLIGSLKTQPREESEKRQTLSPDRTFPITYGMASILQLNGQSFLSLESLKIV